jgi:hypothetical protein
MSAAVHEPGDARPVPTPPEIARWLAVLTEAEQLVELRAPRARPDGNTASHFYASDRLEDLATRALAYSGTVPGVYFTLNPIRPDHPRNRAARDGDVVARRRLLVDCDAVRPGDSSATDPERAAALDVARAIRARLRVLDWPEPAFCDSGNGFHLVYGLDLPNDDASKVLVRACLEALNYQFGTAAVKVDTSVFNASRITKVYGTIAAKGKPTPERPHRHSRLIEAPTCLEYVDPAALQALAADAPPKTIPIHGPAPASRPRREVPADEWSAEDRARAFVLSPKCPDSIAGQRGHDRLYHVACILVDDFGLDFRRAWPILAEWNESKAHPPESDKQLEHKLNDAIKANPSPSLRALNASRPYLGRMSRGFDGSDGSDGRPVGKGPREWRAPRLRESTPAVPFPLEVLPYSLADLCRAAAAAIQCPADYLGAAAVALAGGVLGMTVNLTVKAHYHEASNLYLAAVGDPGTKKSPAIKLLALPLFEIDRLARITFGAARADHLTAVRDHEVARKKGQDPAPPVPPVAVQLTMDDITREAVALVHAENPRGLVLIQDELTAWVASLDAYRQGKGSDKQFWMKVNNGGLVKVNRKGGDREPIIIPQPCITVLGALTPAMLPAIRSQSNDGWIDRILFAYPDPIDVDDWAEAEVPDGLLSDWGRAVRRLWSRRMMTDEAGRLRPFYVRMTPQAKEQWKLWINAHRHERQHPDFAAACKGPWSKLEGYAARLILILSQLRQAYEPAKDEHDTIPAPHDVDALEVIDGCRLADYFKAHFKRARVELVRDGGDVPDDADAMIRWFRHSGRESFSERDARKNFHGRFGRDVLALEDALKWLVRHDIIRPVESPAAPVGRPHSATYEINPLIHDVSTQPE